MYLNYPIVKCRDGSTAFPQKARRHINVKVEFGKGEGKVPLDNIAKRAEGYKPKERVTYKMIKEYIEAKYRKYGYQGFICISISRSFNRCYI